MAAMLPPRSLELEDVTPSEPSPAVPVPCGSSTAPQGVHQETPPAERQETPSEELQKAPMERVGGALCRTVFGPFKYACATVQLQEHPKLNIATVHSVLHKEKIRDQDIQSLLRNAEELIALQRHFTVLHDLRNMTLPTRSQIKTVLAWLPLHRAELDVLVQGIAIVLSNAAVRAVVNFILGVIKPPQPVLLVKDEEAAVKFLSEQCNEVRPWREIYEARKKGHKRGLSRTTSTPTIMASGAAGPGAENGPARSSAFVCSTASGAAGPSPQAPRTDRESDAPDTPNVARALAFSGGSDW